MGNYTILSLDLGSTTGWCMVRNGVITHSGAVALKHKGLKPGARFLEFHNWLTKFHSVNEIAYEDVPFHESNASARVYDGLLAVVQMFCLAHGKRMSCMGPSKVKSIFTGKGNADKMLMCQVAHELGWKRGKLGTDQDHDECDAIALAWCILIKRRQDPRFVHEMAVAT